MATYFGFGPASWELWGILALLLAVSELLDGSGHVLSVGIAATCMAAVAFLSSAVNLTLIPSWNVAFVEFGIFSIASIFVIRKIRSAKREPPDINSY